MSGKGTKFCYENCNNILEVITGADVFFYKCQDCGKSYQPKPEDTRLFHQVMISSDEDKFKDLYANAIHDVSIPDVYMKCTCGQKIVKKIRIQANLIPTYVCKCGRIFN